uniref:GCR152 n=1 Tax=Schmidtea mediterranea TaxID=79327 RepID=A0A193KUG0_SCHMD|nr:GCR152 [Schmidtea mediterranea]
MNFKLILFCKKMSFDFINCSNINGVDILKGQISTYAIYFPLAVCGITLNVFLLIMYFRKYSKFLGKRMTFVICMISLAIADLSNSFILILDLMTTVFTEYMTYRLTQMLMSFRNSMILIESMIFVMLAIDRLLSIVKPLDKIWKPFLVKGIMFCFTTSFVTIDIVMRYIYTNPDISCSIRYLVVGINGKYYIILLITFIIVNYSCYLSLLTYFINHLCKRKVTSTATKNILKMTAIIFISTVLYNLSLIPAIYAVLKQVLVSQTLLNMMFLNIAMNSTIFILNNSSLRRNLICKSNQIDNIDDTKSRSDK